MIHLETRCPDHIEVTTRPSPICGFYGQAHDTRSGATVEAWAEKEADARMRAEYLLNLESA